MAPRTTAIAVATTSTTSTTTRMLVKWSAISFSVTTPKPCKAEPSRRMQLSLVGLEVAGVNRLEARLLDRQTQQAPAGRHHRGRGLRPHVTGGQQSEAIGARRFHLSHPGDRRDAFGKALPFGFNLDAEAAAEHLAAELRHRADERDLALIEQRHAIANALHPFEQVRGQQH